MNAYKVVADLQECIDDGSTDLVCVQEAVTVIRQQADRIAELEKQGKPVAWMQMHHKDNIPTKFSPVKVWEDDIPLYTTSQKETSSDEQHYKSKADYLDKRELELLVKIRKYEEVLHAIANDYHELSNHKIEVQVSNHKKWAREALDEA